MSRAGYNIKQAFSQMGRNKGIYFTAILAITAMMLILGLFFVSFVNVNSFAKSIGLKVNLYQAILATLCSVTIVLGMKLLGALLISSLVIFPCLTAMQFTRNFRTTTIAAAIISVICFIVGLVVSYYYSLPTGASIVVINLICFLKICQQCHRWFHPHSI